MKNLTSLGSAKPKFHSENHFKMKKIAIIALLFLASCSKEFLDTDPKGLDLETNYYQTRDQVFSGLVAVYNRLSVETGGGDNTYSNKLGALNSAADECWTGGANTSDMTTWQVWNNYSLSGAVGPQAQFWKINYEGIYRANLLLQKIAGRDIANLTDTERARFVAEAKFLRAYYYFELVRLFKNVPLILEPLGADAIYSVTQATPEAVYLQIEKDLTEAIADLPNVIPPAENGRVTKGAGMALLGKVILFQNQQNRMSEAAQWFSKVNSSPQYALLPKFSEIFSPLKKYHSESIFEIPHSSAQKAGYWAWGNFMGNVYVHMTGPRSYSGPKYESGWSFNPIISDFAVSMRNDPRYQHTVANLDSLKAKGLASFAVGYQHTGFFIQKFAPLKEFKGVDGDPALNYPNNVIEIRLADTYLMEAEALVRAGGDLATAQQRLDQVRARVGLASKPATLDNIYEERRLELATEGHRWYDLVRTGRAASVLGFKGFKAGVHEILPIPLNELNNTKLVQNPGYQ